MRHGNHKETLPGGHGPRLLALERAVDLMVASDRLYFQRWPDRSHRIRWAHKAEIEAAEIATGTAMPVPSGWRFFVCVKKFTADHRIRALVPFYRNAETDVDEATARQVWDDLASGASEVRS